MVRYHRQRAAVLLIYYIQKRRLTNASVVTPPSDIGYVASWEDVLFLGMLAMSGLVGTVGNTAVVLAFCLYKKVRSAANTFILNTSVWDLVSSAAIIPLFLWSMISGQPNCGEACCAFIGFLSMFSITQSLLSCALIAFNRYVHVVLSLATYKRLFSPVKAFLWVVGAWVTGILIMFPATAGIYGTLGWDAYVHVCQLSSVDPKSVLYMKHILMSTHWAAAFAIFAFYARIYLHVRKSAMSVGQHLGHSPHQVSLQAVKRTKHMFYIFFTFFALTSPGIVLSGYIDPHAILLPKAVFVICVALYYWNTAVNPIIYTWTLKEFRQGFKSMVRCRRHIVPVPLAPNPAVVKTVKLTNLKKAPLRLTVSNRVGQQQAGPSMPVVNT
ncbi:PREDICTED: melatonin-related receptor-like [Branchiostoma belcheri]|uniref:Melatonin-related receptor-like n=1 Tax=Branchiostoma belcheri TaxID=7741 RepID=A0A6P4Z784_BRABE|nr:PREDICTED: melatonin-related receptor-like [Branchiostoma belcheri]